MIRILILIIFPSQLETDLTSRRGYFVASPHPSLLPPTPDSYLMKHCFYSSVHLAPIEPMFSLEDPPELLMLPDLKTDILAVFPVNDRGSQA